MGNSTLFIPVSPAISDPRTFCLGNREGDPTYPAREATGILGYQFYYTSKSFQGPHIYLCFKAGDKWEKMNAFLCNWQAYSC